jgi:hypothetical protein
MEIHALGDFLLPLFDEFVVELLDLPALDANQVIVMIAAIQLEYRVAALEMMPLHQAGRFELGQHTIHGRQPDFLSLCQQKLVYFFGRQVAIVVTPLLEHIQDLDPRQSDL